MLGQHSPAYSGHSTYIRLTSPLATYLFLVSQMTGTVVTSPELKGAADAMVRKPTLTLVLLVIAAILHLGKASATVVL